MRSGQQHQLNITRENAINCGFEQCATAARRRPLPNVHPNARHIARTAQNEMDSRNYQQSKTKQTLELFEKRSLLQIQARIKRRILQINHVTSDSAAR
jgi:hypothetical protein